MDMSDYNLLLHNDLLAHYDNLQESHIASEFWHQKKLYYCVANASASENGVNHKIVSQIAALNNLGVHCIALLTGENLNKTSIWDSVPNIKIEVPKVSSGWFRRSRFVRNCIKSMYSFLRSEPENSYKLYMRYPGANASLYKLCKRFEKCLTMEFNSNEENEIEFLANEHKFSLRPSGFLSWLENSRLQIFNEKFWGTLIRKKLNCMVAPTSEILNYEKERAGKNRVRGLVLGNGISCGDEPLVQQKTLQHNTIKLLFLDGGSLGNDWHGLEFLESALGTNPNDDFTITLTIYGNCPSWAMSHSFITVHSPAPACKVPDIVRKYDIGISSFSLGRIGLKEGSKLKAREYVAGGLPVIYGHHDDDLQPLTNRGLCMKIMPDSTINRTNIVDFAKTFYGNPDNPLKLRIYAQLALDYSVKMKRLATFLNPYEIVSPR